MNLTDMARISDFSVILEGFYSTLCSFYETAIIFILVVPNFKMKCQDDLDQLN